MGQDFARFPSMVNKAHLEDQLESQKEDFELELL